jgi:hypothetical protein
MKEDHNAPQTIALTRGRGDYIERSGSIKWQSASGSLSLRGFYLWRNV